MHALHVSHAHAAVPLLCLQGASLSHSPASSCRGRSSVPATQACTGLGPVRNSCSRPGSSIIRGCSDSCCPGRGLYSSIK
jgi:hypothetical protein